MLWPTSAWSCLASCQVPVACSAHEEHALTCALSSASGAGQRRQEDSDHIGGATEATALLPDSPVTPVPRAPAPQVALREYKVLAYYYWHRLAGTALTWFFWDVSFYGNKMGHPCSFHRTFQDVM